jgi:peptidoglycan/xylan/chitin deacetylase (PgdA/CDA1 family)
MNDELIKIWAATNLSLILDKSAAAFLPYIRKREIGIFRKRFFCLQDSFTERSARSLAQLVLAKASPGKKRGITTLLKQARRVFIRKPILPSQATGTRLILEIAGKVNAGLRGLEDGRGVVCLTHDIDTSEDYDFVPAIIELEERQGVKSAFNFLTGAGYVPEKDLISFLLNRGYEVGLHGITHDITLAYHKPGRIKEILSSAAAQSGLSRYGFRSPALSLSRSLIHALGGTNAVYDSSVSFYYKDLGSCFPYRYPQDPLWELPLALQDDLLFRDFNFTDTRALELVKKYIDEIIGLRGACVLNFHPFLVKQHLDFYRRVLEYLVKNNIPVVLAGRVIEIMEKRLKA